MHLKTLQKQSHAIATSKGFWGKNGKKNRNKAELLMLIVTEVAEACEALRQKDKSKNNISEEMADIAIRVMDFCDAFNIDLEKEIIAKLKVNKTRPILHNKKF